MKILKAICLIGLVCALGLLFSACSGVGAPPKWFLTSQSDEENLYGVGSAKDIDTAKSRALEDLLSAFTQKFSAKTSLDSTTINGEENSNLRQQIDKSIETIKIENITYKSEHIKNLYYVRASVMKKDFINTLKSEGEKIINTLQALSAPCEVLSISEFEVFKSNFTKLYAINDYLSKISSPFKEVKYLEQTLQKNSPKPTLKLQTEGVSKQLQGILEKELIKFYKLDSNSPQVMKISASLHPTQDSNTSIAISLDVRIINCKNSTTFSVQLKEKGHNQAFLEERAGILLYKALRQDIDSQP